MGIDAETYYQDHWLEIEAERLEAYEEMFQWRDALEPLIAPAELAQGHTVVDYGCGPGHLSMELARRVGPSGQIWSLDINREFLQRTRDRADAEGIADRVRV
jgi:ubiquinone/menaquinone biosynthesis C-methylase UbiE